MGRPKLYDKLGCGIQKTFSSEPLAVYYFPHFLPEAPEGSLGLLEDGRVKGWVCRLRGSSLEILAFHRRVAEYLQVD